MESRILGTVATLLTNIIGRPAKKSDKTKGKVQRCQACTSRLKIGSAIYHSGDVGKYCHVSAALKSDANKTKEAKKTPASGTGANTRSRGGVKSDDPPGTPEGEGASPNTMFRELTNLKAKVEALSKPAVTKRKRAPSPEYIESYST